MTRMRELVTLRITQRVDPNVQVCTLGATALYVLEGCNFTILVQSTSKSTLFDQPMLTFNSSDIIVACDANFTQKRCKGQCNNCDAPSIYPDTVFISEEKVKQIEAHVVQLRSNVQLRGRDTLNQVNAEKAGNKCEEGLSVPNSVLDGCQDSFLTANEKREKASTQFFKDTGLMALLCRHDRVLFLINMITAGERQYYAFTLLKELFDQIPDEVTVSVLYDVGCIIHRSCVKYGFLGDILPRIIFGISVFHAYGHQWPCQLVYYSRKRQRFGLSDGEGCERF